MLVAAAVCPDLPSLAGAPDGDATAAPERLRAACAEAVTAVLAAAPDLVAVVAPGPRTLLHPDGRAGGLPTSSGVGVGAALLRRAGWNGPVRAYEVDDDRSWPANGEDGVHLAGWADRVVLLALGNGPTRRDTDRTTGPDPRVAGLDAGIAAALACGDADGWFPDLDADLARELGVSGRSPWQLLDGADEDLTTHRLLHTATVDGTSCFVAVWTW
ncbi:hypothetical protein [Kitasatospora terrestris]|uniref:Class III extradiol dioxygenase subunit B-like domain-containing protein n=1 Tax=Kitasatospora terrestris TaxID=258051 RepID=A0ABP9DAE3_9ACTN